MPVLTALLNLVPVGVVVVRARRQIVLSNPAAEQILAGEDLLIVREGRLAALPSAYDHALTEAIDLAARDTFSRPTAFCMARPQHAPVSIAVAPVDHGAAASSTLAIRKVLVLISDPLHNISVDPETLATMVRIHPSRRLDCSTSGGRQGHNRCCAAPTSQHSYGSQSPKAAFLENKHQQTLRALAPAAA